MAEEFNLDGMVDIYIYENGQLLENLEEIVLETKDDDAFDENSINEIFRIMHTIKGSSGVMMYDNIMKVSQEKMLVSKSRTWSLPTLFFRCWTLSTERWRRSKMEMTQTGIIPN